MILAAAGAVRVMGLPVEDPPAQPKPAPVSHVPAPKAGREGTARVEAPRLIHEVGRLKTLLEAAEKAAEGKDWDGAVTRADEAEVLVADWPDELLVQPEVAALLQRLQNLEQHLPETESVPAVPDPGLKEGVEIGPLSKEELTAEMAQVRSAEIGAVFDFPIDLNDKVLAWVHLFTTSKRGFMERSLSRGSRYLPMVRTIFAEERIPQDLAYLAVIESGFINSANSYAKAVGMWQFMRSTGRIYGLNGNAWIEERRDPVKATRAAARYLRQLYETSGDWYLALVGYNAGPMTTYRAIQNLGTRNFWDMHRSRWLRTQTKNYISEMCAAVLVGRFPERYGLTVQQLPPYAYETVDVDRMTSLAVLAHYSDADVDLLRDLNPELLRATTPPGRYALRVPPGTSDATARALARIPLNLRLDFKTYKIRKGDTLAKLAAKFKVGTEDLLEANDLTKAQFRAGRTIKVPPPPPTPIDDRDLLSKSERAKTIEEKPLENLPAIPAVRASEPAETEVVSEPAAPSLQEGTERVQEPGEAQPPVALPTPAQIPPPAPPEAAVKPGRAEAAAVEPSAAEARKPEPAAQAPGARRPGKAAAASRKNEDSSPAVHVVKRGETLFAISVRYGLELSDLRKWNKIKGNSIRPGQKLRLHR